MISEVNGGGELPKTSTPHERGGGCLVKDGVCGPVNGAANEAPGRRQLVAFSRRKNY